MTWTFLPSPWVSDAFFFDVLDEQLVRKIRWQQVSLVIDVLTRVSCGFLLQLGLNYTVCCILVITNYLFLLNLLGHSHL